MVCAGCKNLDTKKKYDGKAGGSKYYCKKLKTYVRANQDVCSKFDKSYTRDTDEYNKLYKEGTDFDDDGHSPSFYFIVAAILIIILIIVNLVN